MRLSDSQVSFSFLLPSGSDPGLEEKDDGWSSGYFNHSLSSVMQCGRKNIGIPLVFEREFSDVHSKLLLTPHCWNLITKPHLTAKISVKCGLLAIFQHDSNI